VIEADHGRGPRQGTCMMGKRVISRLNASKDYPSSVSDFVLHAAKQSGGAILEGIVRCWHFPGFAQAGRAQAAGSRQKPQPICSRGHCLGVGAIKVFRVGL
jgi:hypothetical protein